MGIGFPSPLEYIRFGRARPYPTTDDFAAMDGDSLIPIASREEQVVTIGATALKPILDELLAEREAIIASRPETD